MDDQTRIINLPPLERCLVVDSRFSSRKSLVEQLKSSTLFTEIIEAESLYDGIQMLSKEELNMGLVGPTVTVKKALKFITKAKQVSSTGSTAFLALVDEQTKAQFRSVGADEVLVSPYSLENFQDSIVRAVIAADKESLWNTLLEDSKPSVNFEIASLDKKDLPQRNLPQRNIPQRTNSEILEDLLANTALTLKRLVGGYQRGEFMLSPNGKPSPRTLQTITDLTKGLFDAERGGLTNAQKIESEFRDAIENWFVDLVLTGDKAATQKLRLRLLSLNH